MSNVTEKELKVIEAIDEDPQSTQRSISDKSGVSLGLTNVLINRLVKKGYLKVKRFNPRNIKYILTPRGMKEKTKKTYRFMKRSFKVIGKLKQKIAGYAAGKYEKGCRKFIILGTGELAEITEIVLKSLDLEDSEILSVETLEEDIEEGVIFNTDSDKLEVKNDNVLNLWDKAEELYGSRYEL